PHLHLHSFPTRRSSDLVCLPYLRQPDIRDQECFSKYSDLPAVLGRPCVRGAQRHDSGQWWPSSQTDEQICSPHYCVVPAECGRQDRKSTRLNSSHVKIS